jgi:beta-lactam-binding protein with PASTA domain/tRNA A-37 threonylcarbamoyl transferase component Bud32
VPEVAENAIVDGRYRILGQLGTGGMADVYRAEDAHLGRQLALKVLHPRFAQDQQFVERFRREASAAAGLQHPSIVAVYDRGTHEDTYYIAMELLHGRQLKELLAEEGPLSLERAIDLLLQVLEAAGFAHRHGVIHRDFKPQNVMVDEEDRVMVTDFGIARAGVSEMTEAGSILGTAQYLSPEQAQGQSVGLASDLYSIGVMLFEMLTGRLPFSGDSAVAIAVKHLSEAPPSPRSLRPDLPPALEAVVLRALAKDPGQRFTSAEEFASALTGVRASLDGGGASAAVLPPPPLPPPYPTVPSAVIEEMEGEERGRRRAAWIALGVLGLVVAALLAFFLLRGESVTVPNLAGRPVGEATATLERAGLRVQAVRVTSGAPMDSVVEQSPGPGVEVDRGAQVILRVSSGPGDAAVPSVRDLPKRRAVQKLNDAGFNVEERPQASTTVPRGSAVRTSPREGERIEKGSRVRLFVSTGPRVVVVPSVVGLSRDAAEARLRDRGLEAVFDEQPSDGPPDRALSQDPVGGSRAKEGSTVTVAVAEKSVASDDAPSADDPAGAPAPGPSAPAEVPEVEGLVESDARARLEAQGLSVQVRDRSVGDPEDEGMVLSQRPAAGRRLVRGRTVVIYVGRAEDGGGPAPAPQL